MTITTCDVRSKRAFGLNDEEWSEQVKQNQEEMGVFMHKIGEALEQQTPDDADEDGIVDPLPEAWRSTSECAMPRLRRRIKRRSRWRQLNVRRALLPVKLETGKSGLPTSFAQENNNL